MATAGVPDFPPLTQNLSAEVIIVGAGIAGLTTAYLLTKSGRSVLVLDDGPILSGETERTTAHLVNALDDRYYRLRRLHGQEGARLAAESHTAAIDEIERIVKAEKIDCQFERLDGFLFAPPEEREAVILWEHEAAQAAGLADVEVVASAKLPKYQTGPALRFPRQAQFHPLRYLVALARAIARDGGQIHGHTHVKDIKGGKTAEVHTSNGLVLTAKAVVMATNSPVNDRLVIHTKQAAYRTYVIGARVARGSVPRALFWDTGDPYHYVRLQDLPGEADDLLIIGGEDHKTGQKDDGADRYENLRRWAAERFPIGEIRFRWSGQVMEPVDSLAFIGHNPVDRNNVYIATGDSGNGMTHGTIAGMLLDDLICGRENRWARLYDPARKSLGAAGDYTRENTNMAAQYRDWLTRGDVKSADEIPASSGAIVRHGLTKAAVYRDSLGELHECSAVCPHLGGLVRWNHAENTWDCPCHGSRFDPYGHVLNGPAISDLHAHEAAHAKAGH